jgi:hypothetical protein
MKLVRKPTTRSWRALFCTTALVSTVIPAAGAAYPDLILGDHPVAYYRLEEPASSTTAVDSGPNVFDATYVYDMATNGVLDYPVLGLPGLDTNAPLFLVYNDALLAQHHGFVDIPFHPELSPVTGDGQHGAPFSAECWVQPVSQPADYSIPLSMFGKYESSPPYGNASGWNFYQSPGPNSYWILNVKNGPFAQASTLHIQLYQWYHLAVTFDGSTFVFYTNGAAAITSPGNTGYLADHNFDGQIGAGDNSGFLPFNGSVDEVAFYTNVLTATQITNHYAAGLTSFVARSFPPLVLLGPASQTVNSGSQAKFTGIVDGATPLSFKWLRNGSLLSGATTNPLAFTATYPADDGSTFQLIVTNVYGSVTSAVATLGVVGTLTIDHNPFSITREEGAHSKAAFRVVAGGSNPIHYQWYKISADGTTTNVIAGATNDTLWLSGLQLADSGTAYFASVTNHFVVTNGGVASLTVLSRAVSVPVTGYARLVVGDDPVAYWRLDEPNGSGVATDAVGSFDGAYQTTSGALTFGVPSGIPREPDPAINVSGGSVVTIPYALEINPVSGPWSFEAWIRPTALDPVNFITPYSSLWNSDFGGHLFGWNIYQHPQGYWTFNAFNGGGGGSFTSDFAHHPLDTNLWYHMVITDDTTTLRYYVNDLLVVTIDVHSFGFLQNGINGDPGVAGAPTVLGQRSDDAFLPFNGDIDEVATYNYALSPTQIGNHFVNNVGITITKSGNNAVVAWPGVGLTLQASPNLSGSSFTNVVGATSPYTTPIGSAPKYFRVKLQ